MADETETETIEQTEPSVETPVETKETDETPAPEPSEAEQKLTEQMSELQGKFDTLSQDASKNKHLLDEISPYVNFDRMKRGQDSEPDVIEEEGEETFLTQAEAKALEKRIDQKIATSDFQRDFRTKYPDLGDRGPKEEMVRYFFENKTFRADSFEKRLDSAVNATRALLKSEQDKGVTKVKADEEKTAQETKAKAEAAAKASGLSSAGITSPKPSEGSSETETSADYVASRKSRLAKLRE